MVDQPKDGKPDSAPKEKTEAPKTSKRSETAELELRPEQQAGDPNEKSSEGAPADSTPAKERDVEQSFFPQEDDEIDPELMQIPAGKRLRRRRHPIISAIVIALSLYLMFFMREDIAFFFQPRKAVDVGEAQKAFDAGKLRPNTYVRLTGTPDRKHALVIESRSSGYDSFVRIFETTNRLFIQRHRELRYTDRPFSIVHEGQLVRFDSLSYHDNLRRYFSKGMTIPHELSFKELVRAKRSGTDNVRAKDIKSQQVRLTPDSVLWINVEYENEWLVQFHKKYHTREKAEQQMSAGNMPFALDSEPSHLFWRFVVLAEPDQEQILKARFHDRTRHIGVIRRQLSYSARWDQISIKADSLLIEAADPTFPSRYKLGKGATSEGGKLIPYTDSVVAIPSTSLKSIETSSPFDIPDDALVLLTDRKPSENWYYLVLYVVLVGFILLNVIILIRRFRIRR